MSATLTRRSPEYMQGWHDALQAVRVGQRMAGLQGAEPAPCPRGCEQGLPRPGCPVHDPTAPPPLLD